MLGAGPDTGKTATGHAALVRDDGMNHSNANIGVMCMNTPTGMGDGGKDIAALRGLGTREPSLDIQDVRFFRLGNRVEFGPARMVDMSAIDMQRPRHAVGVVPDRVNIVR